MDLTTLRPVVDGSGPFVTVYLEGRAPAEDAAQQVRLRWKDQRERLQNQDADPAALDAVEDALFGEQAGEVHTDGRVLVATAAGVALDAPWDAALGSGDAAYWTAAPELGAYVRERARAVRLLVVVAHDQQHATVRQEVVAAGHDLTEFDAETVTGTSRGGTHKPRGQALSHNQIQRRAEEATQRNARDIVARAAEVAATFDPRRLVLAGEAQARTAIHAELPVDLAEICVDVDRGGSDDDTAEEVLAEELRRVASDCSAQHAAARTEQFETAAAQQLATDGAGPVGQAAQMAAVETLLFTHTQPASAEAALVSDCVRAGAEVDLVDTELTDGVGAILRFPLHPDDPQGRRQ